MSEAISNQEKGIRRKARAAGRQITLFEERFGQAHMNLLCHAAFPLALTPDLLYRLWANFQRDVGGRVLNIPWVAVSDILLSGMCEEVGQEIYEMDQAVRNELIKRLQNSANFGQQRINELSDFLLEYVHQQLQSNEPDIRDAAQVQRWTVLAYTQPGKATRELAAAFQQLGLDETLSTRQHKTEVVRLASLVGTFAEPLADAGLEPLLTYANGMTNWARGKTQQAAKTLEKIAVDGKIQIAGVGLPIPVGLEEHSGQFSQRPGPDYSDQNLRGRSFKGQDLTRANFSNADLRSTDFTNAILVGVNFSGAKMGLQRRWATVLILVFLWLSILSGLFTTLVGAIGGLGLYLVLDNLPLVGEPLILTGAGSIGFIWFLILCVTTFWRPMKPAWTASALALLGASLFAGSISIPIAWVGGLVNSGSNIVAIISSVIALGLGLGLTRGITGKLLSMPMALTGTTVALVLALVFLTGSANVTVILALALISLVLALGLIWSGNRLERLSKTLGIVGIFSGLVTLITGIALSFNQVELITIVWIASLSAILAIIVVIPLIFSGVSSLLGSFIGTLIVPVAISIFLTLMWLNGLSSYPMWVEFAPLIEISVLIGTIAWAIIITIASTVNLVSAEANNKTIALIWTLLGILPLIISAVIVTLLIMPWLPALGFNRQSFLISFVSGTILAVSIVVLGVYIGWQALLGNKKFISTRDLAIAIAVKGGTSFHGADLTDANFAGAILKSADFRKATLTRTRWFNTHKLDHACVESSFLQSAQVRHLAITGIGQDKSFDYLELPGINLQQANLADASFIGTNLTGANLRNVDLSRARIIKTQLNKADLFGARLTGAYIQDVQITAATNLRGIECQYFFTRLPTEENRDPGRIPADYRTIFKPGEFANYILGK